MLGSFGFGSFVISRLWISAQPIKTRHHLPHTHKKCCRFYASVCVCVCLSGEAHDVNGLIQMAAHQTDFINPNNVNMQMDRLHPSSLCIPHLFDLIRPSVTKSHNIALFLLRSTPEENYSGVVFISSSASRLLFFFFCAISFPAHYQAYSARILSQPKLKIKLTFAVATNNCYNYLTYSLEKICFCNNFLILNCFDLFLHTLKRLLSI